MSQQTTTFSRAFDAAMKSGRLFAAPKQTSTKAVSKPAKTATAALRVRVANLNSLGRPAQGPVDQGALKGALQAVQQAFSPALKALDKAAKEFARSEARLRAESVRLARKAIAARRAAIQAITGSKPVIPAVPIEGIASAWAQALPRMARAGYARLIRAGQRLAGWAQSLAPGKRAWREAMREEARLVSIALFSA